MGRLVGIDLGTTNSCLSFIEGHDPVVVPNSEGGRTTPSIVAYSEGEVLVGSVAKRQALTNPKDTVVAVKRLIGGRFDSDAVQSAIQHLSYRVREHDNGDAWVFAGGQERSPSSISAETLRALKKYAEAFLGEEVDSAVITVPAYFNDSQRQATKDAGRIAGLDVQRIINEPTAAALAYGLNAGAAKRRIAVYDLGGGTFDISILELNDGVFQVLSTNGDTFLGGEDFDRVLIDMLANHFFEKHSIDLRQDSMALQRLKESAEKAKHELSSSDSTEVQLPFIASTAEGPQHLQMTISRSAFEALSEGLVRRTMEPCEQALKDSGLSAADLDDVLLIGGMTRMPLVQRNVEAFFKREANRSINPDEAVALGAAVQAGILSGQIRDVVLLDVTPLTLAVETQGGVATPMIERNASIPCKHSMVFSTTEDNQPMVSVHVTQGERPMSDDNRTLARFELVGIPPAPRGVPQIDVRFEIDVNGIVSVSARDLGTGKEQSVRITSSSGLTEDEIQAAVEEALTHEKKDQERRDAADIFAKAKGLLYSVEKAITEYGHALEPEMLSMMEERASKMRDAIKDENATSVSALLDDLESGSHEVANAMYSSLETSNLGESEDDFEDLDI